MDNEVDREIMTKRDPMATRERLLQTAYEQMHVFGYRGLRVDEVLRIADLRKGAFYHHFESKAELAHAVLEEKIQPLIRQIWIEPLKQIKDPVVELPRMIAELGNHFSPLMREHGCPLNNLAQEMASVDDKFQSGVAAVIHEWIESLTCIFNKIIDKGDLRAGVEAEEMSRFILAVIEGSISISKAERSSLQWRACQSQLEVYLKSLT